MFYKVFIFLSINSEASVVKHIQNVVNLFLYFGDCTVRDAIFGEYVWAIVSIKWQKNVDDTTRPVHLLTRWRYMFG